MSFTRWIPLVGFLFGPLVLPAQQDPSEVFAEANELFRQANQLQAGDPQQAHATYRRAALRYEHLIGERGIRSGKLHYNLANAYHQLGEIGRAILHYRIAERLEPGDPNVLRNLEYARSKRQDRLESDAGRQALETLLFWHYEFSLPTRVRLLAGAWVLFWAAMLLRLLGSRWVAREVAIGLGAGVILLLGSVVYEAAVARRSLEGVIVVPDTVARQGDGQSYESAFQDPLHAGVEFRVLEERPDWYQVELPDGRRCWLAASDVDLVR